jgi:hypothetical protein
MGTMLKGLASALLAAALAGCGSAPSGPQRVTLANLVEFPGRYEGRMVITEGQARSHADPEHYWIEDADLNRVQIVPGSTISHHVGERVRVRGVFSHPKDKGRRIDTERAVVIDD